MSPPRSPLSSPVQSTFPYSPLSVSSEFSAAESTISLLPENASVGVVHLGQVAKSRRSLRASAVLLSGILVGVILLWSLSSEAIVPVQLQEEVYSLSRPLAKLAKLPGKALTASTSRKGDSGVSCDPFEQPGQVYAQQGNPDANYWKPWDTSCEPSTLMTALRNREDLPWLQNKTIAVIGDSLDRDHVEYFCEMSKGNMEWVWEDTRYSPPYTYSPGDGEDYQIDNNGQDEGGASQSRPRICRIEEYDFSLIFTFHFGLSDGSKAERELPHFYPPFRFQDRLNDILVPILKSADAYPPTLVEMATGTWDLQHWTYADREIEYDRLSPISSKRAEWYKERFTRALNFIEDAFPEEQGTALVFREMLHTKMVDTVPPPRVHGLTDLQKVLLEKENESAEGRWDSNPLGRLLIGQEHSYRDMIHPIMLPAGKLWADIILHKLKNHVEGQFKSSTMGLW